MTTALLIRNARLIDGTGAAPCTADVLVNDGVIDRISPSGSTPLPSTINEAVLTTIDAGGLTLLPGFFDCHTHVTTNPGGSTIEFVVEPESAKTLRAVPHLRALLDSGVTTVRDLAGADSGFRDAVEHGVIAGPQLLIAIRILSITGGHGDWRTVGGTPLDSGPSAGAIGNSPADFVRLTREVIREGADWIKIAATGGMGSPRSDPTGGGLSENEMRAVVEEAARHGIAGVAAHAIGTAGIAAAVRAGVRSIEHGYLIDDATIDEMGERGTFLVPTLSTLTRPPSPNAAPWTLAKRARTLDSARERLAEAIGAGIPVALGTDAGIVVHGTTLRELALLVEFGMSPMGAIMAGTSQAAKMCGQDDVGTIEVGKRADLIATAHDPLTDLESLGKEGAISLVVQAGRVHLSPSELSK